MRLLILTFDPPENVGGVEGRASAYTEQLLKMGNAVELISFGGNSSFREENFHGARLWGYPSRTIFVPKSFRRTANEISSGRIDSLFFQSGAITLFGVLILFYARLMGIRTGIFLYGKDILETNRKPFDRFALFISQMLARKILVNSRFTRGLLPRFFRRKTRILYPGVDPSIASGKNRIKNESGVILFVGRLVRRKGVDDLLSAFKDMSSEFKHARVEIVGDGPDLLRLRNLTEKLGLTERVRFYGNLRGEALFERYREAEVFVMPSRKTKNDVEGFGTVFLEAGLFGLPSIGTRSGGIPEAVLEGETGILVDEGDVFALKTAIETLMKDKALRMNLGQRARERVLTNFTWEKSTNSLIFAFSDG